ncbi:hypothetical protein ACFE04_006232 [Oxalis oulophora]
MHKILSHVQHRHDDSAITIPSFLPPKVKELLAELAMVEGEITRLENQISQLQTGLKQEQEITKDKTKSNQWQPGVLNKLLQTPLNQNSLVREDRQVTKVDSKSKQWPIGFLSKFHQGNSRNVEEKMAFDSTKALHFISKAIKGDYDISDFALNEKIGNSRIVKDHKDNLESVSRKSGLLRPSDSPLRDFRHPTPRPSRVDRTLETSFDLPPKSTPTQFLPPQETIQNWQPNKLSESIMKCLNFIYIRLLRTSRALELEKIGQIGSRSTPVHHSTLSSRSFRSDQVMGINTSPRVTTQKGVRQQDPYGIFDTEESLPRDIGPYKHLVIFTASSMDPKCISSSSSIPLLKKLRVLMSNLQTVELRSLSFHQKLAFWINIYNACIMHGFLQYGVPGTSDKLLTLMNKATVNVGGHKINAPEIERYILRKHVVAASSMRGVLQKGQDDQEIIVRKLFGLESMDPNVTFALCCGTRSSPAVKVYTAENVISELEKSKLEYLQASILVTNTKRIGFPELLVRNMFDFAMDMGTLVEWACHQLPTSGSLRKSMVDCFKDFNNGKVSASPSVEKISYDYDFQYLLGLQ